MIIMAMVSLPISGLTRAMLIVHYPHLTTNGKIDYIVVSPSTHLGLILTSTVAKSVYDENVLTDTMIVDTRVNINCDLRGCGMALHRHYIYQCMIWVHAAVRSGQSASAAIRSLYDYYSIDEDLWSMETALRTWQRYCKRLDDKLNDGPMRGRDIALAPRVRPVLSDDMVHRCVAAGHAHYYHANERWNHVAYRSLVAYAMYDIGYTLKEISISQIEPVTTIHDRINYYSRMMSKSPDLRATYHKIIGEWMRSLGHDSRSRKKSLRTRPVKSGRDQVTPASR